MSEQLISFVETLKEEYERHIGWAPNLEHDYQTLLKILKSPMFLRGNVQQKSGKPGFSIVTEISYQELEGIPTEESLAIIRKRFNTMRDMSTKLFKLYREIEEAKEMISGGTQVRMAEKDISIQIDCPESTGSPPGRK